MQIVYVYHNTNDDTYKGVIQATSSEISSVDKTSPVVTIEGISMTMTAGSVIQCVDDVGKTLVLIENEWK